MKLQEYADREMMAIDLANQLTGELETCLFNHDHASLAVPGGTTPGNCGGGSGSGYCAWGPVGTPL